jgi:hypothetical protein
MILGLRARLIRALLDPRGWIDLAILVGFNDNVPLFNQSKLSCRMNDFLFV